MQSKDFFSYIRDFDHNLGIYLTFTLDKEVIEKIRENSIGRTVILHDYKQGKSQEDTWDSRVLCLPTIPTTNKCFHAKMALLKGKYGNCKLLIGSMNLSKNSFSSPVDICCAIDMSFNSPILRSIVEYFEQQLTGLIYKESPEWGNIVKEISSIDSTVSVEKSNLENIVFICNSEEKSISTLLIEYLREQQIKNKLLLHIVSPFLSRKYDQHLDEFLKEIDAPKIYLYSRRKANLADSLKNNEKLNISLPVNKKSKENFHAKMVLLDCGDKSFLYIGSANFTNEGFFRNLSEGANNECGLIIRLSNKLEKDAILDWLTKGWEKPIPPAICKMEKAEAQEEERPEPYAWAEKNGNEIKVFIFFPDKLSIRKVKIDGKNYVLSQMKEDVNIFYCSIKLSQEKEIITVKIPNYDAELKVAIFSAEKFGEARKYDGDSLFSYDDSKIDSIRESVIREGIERDGIKVSVGRGVTVIEPPILEQFYHNAREKFVEIIKRSNKSVFSKYHLSELESELKKQHGGTGIYFISQLYKIFKSKKLIDFYKPCMDKLKELASEENVITFDGADGYESFLEKWSK